MKAEVITIGDEILYGQITDTNSQWISAELDKLGIKTSRKTSVGDEKKEILTILEEAFSRVDLIICTGGLGPTKDDITKTTLAEFFKVDLIESAEALQQVTEFFAQRNKVLTPINKKQALIPQGTKVIHNECGTAPGMWIENNGKVLISMPGVPFEMKAMMEKSILSLIKSHFNTPYIIHKMIKLVGIGESYLSDMIESWELALPSHIKLAYLPSINFLRLRLTGVSDNKETLFQEIEQEFKKVKPQIAPYLVGFDEENVEQKLADLLIKNQLTIATAESCTAGLVATKLTSIAGSSAYFKGSIIAYANEVKISALNVSPSDLENYGAVSEQVVVQMAENVRKKLNTSIGISTSGIAGPGGGTAEKPVGTIWIAIATEKETITRKLALGNVRENNVQLTTTTLLNDLRKHLLAKYE